MLNLILAHAHYFGIVHECGCDARHIVFDTSASNITEVELHLKICLLCLAANCCHQQVNKKEPFSFHINSLRVVLF